MINIPPTKNKPIIKVKNLVKQYQKAKKTALKEINLEVVQGEFFGLLGPNGSGKTTLISILCGLLSATRGEATICDYSTRHNLKEIKPLIGLVPQDIALYPNLSLQHNLEFFASLYGLAGKLKRDRITKYLEMACLTQFADNPIKTFSGGMKRRANLAAGLLHEPTLLFLDEPTVNVDPQSRNVIFESLRALIEMGTTIVYTTHYLEEAEQLCSRIAIIDTGEFITEGSPDELVASVPGCHDLGEVFLRLTGKQLRD